MRWVPGTGRSPTCFLLTIKWLYLLYLSYSGAKCGRVRKDWDTISLQQGATTCYNRRMRYRKKIKERRSKKKVYLSASGIYYPHTSSFYPHHFILYLTFCQVTYLMSDIKYLIYNPASKQKLGEKKLGHSAEISLHRCKLKYNYGSQFYYCFLGIEPDKKRS